MNQDVQHSESVLVVPHELGHLRAEWWWFLILGVLLVIRFPQWGWSLLSGVHTTLVGLVIYKNLPEDTIWVIGTLIGIQLIFDGWFWIMIATAIRRLPLSRV